MDVAARNEEGRGPGYWGLPGERWPRAAERRHFRGDKCKEAVRWMKTHSQVPEDLVLGLSEFKTAHAVMESVQRWPMFGPWVSFKVADMLERVWGTPIVFDRDIGLFYAEPRAGLEMAALRQGLPVTELYNNLLTLFRDWPAPPVKDGDGTLRRCGPQEVETVLCKWKSYMGGHYYIGKDIHEQREALEGWGVTAERIAKAYPKEVPNATLYGS